MKEVGNVEIKWLDQAHELKNKTRIKTYVFFTVIFLVDYAT